MKDDSLGFKGPLTVSTPASEVLSAPPQRVVSVQEFEDLLATEGEDLHGVAVAFGRPNDPPCSPVWMAVVMADEELLQRLLADDGPAACRSQVNVYDENSRCFPIHCAAKLQLLAAVESLIEAGADVNVQNGDLFNLGMSGFRLLPECGGQTALHFLCKQREHDDLIASCRQLLAARADVDLKDHLGLSAVDLAVTHGNERAVELLSQAQTATPHAIQRRRWSKEEVRELCRERETQWKKQHLLEKRIERQRSLSWIACCYRPKHAWLYSAEGLAACVQKSLGPVEHAHLRATELCKGVFGFADFLPVDICLMLAQEIESFTYWADSSGFQVQRPNSMNRYGAVLNDVGFEDAMHRLMQEVVAPLATALQLAAGVSSSAHAAAEADGSSPFRSQHSFTVRYRANEDEDLKTHRDDSDVTLNLCLGREFEGADVYFHAPPQVSHGSPAPAMACESCHSADEYAYPHPEACKFCTFRHRHVPGTAILHLGRHVHGVDRLRAGERVNLIMWCRARSYPPEMLSDAP